MNKSVIRFSYWACVVMALLNAIFVVWDSFTIITHGIDVLVAIAFVVNVFAVPVCSFAAILLHFLGSEN